MAISIRATGTWAEFTTDLQTVTIPGSPAAGDRMYLWVQWKDFAITLAQPSGWNTIVNSFADGSVSTGNGLGSISTAVFYRDWQSGDSAPTLDFSTTTGLLAEAVIIIFQKGASPEVFKAPEFYTAAWPATSTTQTVSASSSGLVPDNSVVMAGIGLRDDSATFTRAATTGIDVSSGITWSADYVEAPATHYSTTTGNDHSGDLGYRLITTGGSGTTAVSLRVTATISATETGSVVWVVQGVDTPTTVTPTTLAHTLTTFAPTVTATNNKLVTPSTLALTLTTFAPTIRLNKIATPSTKALALSTFAPTISAPRLVTPPMALLSLTTFAPSVAVTNNVRAVPATVALALSTFAPAVSTPTAVTPATASLSTTAFAPSVQTPRLVTPTTASLVTSTFAPSAQTPVLATPATAPLATTSFAPTVSTPRTATPATATFVLTTFAPDVEVTTGGDITVTPQTKALVTNTFAPTVATPRTVTPATAQLTLTEFAPVVQLPVSVTPATSVLSLTTFAPTVTGGSGGTVTPITVALTLATHPPTVIVSTPPRVQGTIIVSAENHTVKIARSANMLPVSGLLATILRI